MGRVLELLHHTYLRCHHSCIGRVRGLAVVDANSNSIHFCMHLRACCLQRSIATLLCATRQHHIVT